MTATVRSLHRYPVKSMLGEDLDRCVVEPGGVVGDRAYALVDQSDGKVASAKNPRKWGALLSWSARYVEEPVPGAALPPVELSGPSGERLRSDQADVSERLSEAVGRSVRLTTAAPQDAVFEEVWPDVEGLAPREFIRSTTTRHEPTGEATSDLALGLLAPPGAFFDLAVLHLLTTSTLAELARLAPGGGFDARRYRPNVLLDGVQEGFPEDGWVGREVRLGSDVRSPVRMLTMRCVMTTVRQRDLAADPGTLRALARHHRREIAGLGTWACAGVYAGVSAPGVVRVGDEVTLLPGPP